MNIDAPIPAMTPQSVAPAAAAQAVVAPEPTSRFQAYRQIGLIQPIDYFMLIVLSVLVANAVFAVVFGAMSLILGAVLAILGALAMMFWLLLVIFRVGVLVIELRARIELLPYDSAKIAVSYLQGGGR